MAVGTITLPNGGSYTYGKNLYILGLSESGPLLDPVHIKTAEHAKKVFGDPFKGNLIQAWNEAFQVGGTDINIYLVRISGERAEIELFGRDKYGSAKKEIVLRCTNAGELWNETSVYITDSAIEIQNPSAVGGDTYIFTFEKYPTIMQLAQAINDQTARGNLYITATALQNFDDTTNILRYHKNNLWLRNQFQYGENGLNITKNQLHDRLEIAYNILEGQPIDIICVAEAYFDDISPTAYYNDKGYGELFYTAQRDYLVKKHPTEADKPATFHGQMIDFCYKQANLSIITHGVMAFNPLENIEDLFEEQSYFIKAANATCFSDRFDLITKDGPEITDHGKFISVTIGEFEYTSTEGFSYYNNGYLGYAALLTSKLTADSTTNMAIPNISNLRYHIDDSEILALAKLGIVTFRYSVLKDTIVVCNGVTTGIDGSPYHTVSNVRMVQLVLAAYKQMLDSFIGENVEKLIASKAMDKAVEQLAVQLKSDKIVRNIKPNLKLSSSGVAVVNLDILTNYSIEYVSATGQTKL